MPVTIAGVAKTKKARNRLPNTDFSRRSSARSPRPLDGDFREGPGTTVSVSVQSTSRDLTGPVPRSTVTRLEMSRLVDFTALFRLVDEPRHHFQEARGGRPSRRPAH